VILPTLCCYVEGKTTRWREVDSDSEPDPVAERAERVRGMDAEPEQGAGHTPDLKSGVYSSLLGAPIKIEGDRAPTDPPYYADGDIECWDVIWQQRGLAGGMAHVDGYAFRLGKKPGVPPEVDLQKIINWCEFMKRKIMEDK